jgi:hypothetical protein
MSTAAKQNKIPETASLAVSRETLDRMPQWDKDELRRYWDRSMTTQNTVWLKDTAAVRAIFRKHGLLSEERK